MTDKINEIDGRLRIVEQSVIRIETKLDNIPTKTELWRAGAKVAVTTILAAAGVIWWIVQQYLSPILQKLGGA